MKYAPISASVALAKGQEIQACSTLEVLRIISKTVTVSEMVSIPWAVSLDIETMDVVNGDEDSN